MRTLKRNKTKLYYALFVESEEIEDEEGNFIGHKPIYSEPVAYECNKSPSKGELAMRLFGETIQYDRVLLFQKDNAPAMNELSVFWIDDLDVDKPYDYTVKAVATSLNNIVIAVKKVNVSAND